MKNYIQLDDDRFFRVSLVEGKPIMVEVKPEEVCAWEVEKMCLGDGTDAIEVSMFQEIIDNTRIDMQEKLENSLKDLIVKSLGFSRSDKGFYISGFNEDKSIIVQHLASKLEKRIKETDLDRDFNLTDLEKKQMRASMKAAFKERYGRALNSLVYEKAEALAREHVNQIVRELTESKLKDVAAGLLKQAIRKSSSII